MAIRLRRVEDGTLVALCAARSVSKMGDVYLDDEAHHALSIKFSLDLYSMYGTGIPPYADSAEAAFMAREERNNG